MKLLPSALATLAALVLVGAGARSSPTHDDWPAWRGADRTGVSRETGLLNRWPEGGPKLLWKASGLGEGFSTPSVAGKMIYVMGYRDGREWVMELDALAEGKQVWATPTGSDRAEAGGYRGPRSTPTIDGNRVYALGLNGDLVCLDAKTGALKWGQSLRQDFAGNVGGWGYAESVLIDGPWLVCTPGGSQATLIALKKKDGQPVWMSPVGDTADYASVIKIEAGGLKQYVQLTKQGVIGVNAKTGEFLWRYDRPANGTANCSTPVFADDSVFAASGYGRGGGLVHLERHGARVEAKQVYETSEMINHHGGMVLVGGYLYGSSDPGILTCLEFKTGKVVWRDRAPGKCSLVCADGLLFCRSESGLVTLVRATPEKFELLGRFDQPERSNAASWPHPVVAGGRLYLRDQDNLFCYDVRGDGR